MGAFAGSKIANDDLLFAFDIADIRSFRGRENANLLSATPNSNGTSVGRVPMEGQLKQLAGDVWQRKSYTHNTTDWIDLFQASGIDVPAGSTMILSCYVYILNATNRFNSNANWGATLGTNRSYSSIYTNQNLAPGRWHRLAFKAANTTGATITVNSIRMEPYNAANWNGERNFFSANPMCEVVASGEFEFPSRFRRPDFNEADNTATFLDWTKQTTITRAGTITYNAVDEFEFGAPAGTPYLTAADPGYPTAWTNNYSFEAWHYIPSGADWHDTTTFGSNSGTCIVGRGSYPGSHGLARRDTNLLSHLVRTDSGLYFADYTGTTDTWYHLVGTYDGTNNRLYVNGNLEATTAVTITGVPDQGGVRIGGNLAYGGNNGGYAEGKTHIVRMYRKALSAREVRDNFQAQRNRFGV